MNQIPVYVFLLIPLNLFILLTILKTALPSRLFVQPHRYNRSTILWEIFFGFWLLINLVGLVAVDYLNQNPVETGLVFRAEHYRYSRLDDADKNRIFIFQTAKRIAIWQGIYSK